MRTQYAGLSRPDILVDAASAVRNAGRQVAWSEVPDTFRATPGFNVESDGTPSAGSAVEVAVEALPGPIPAGTQLVSDDGAKTMTLTADAAAGATTVTADLPEDLVDADTFVYKGAGEKIIKHGNPVQPASGDADKIVPAVSGDGTAFGLLEGPAKENDNAAALSGYGVIVGGVIYRDLVPNLDGTLEAQLKSDGMGFRFEDYADSRSS